MSATPHVPYWQKLLDVRWQRKRLEIFNRDNFACRNCGLGGGGITLHVHHFLYRKNTEPWDYPNHELWTMCAECHKNEEEDREAFLSLMSTLPAFTIGSLGHAIQILIGNDVSVWAWTKAAEFPDLMHEARIRYRREFWDQEDYSI